MSAVFTGMTIKRLQYYCQHTQNVSTI